jgi:hypothetical protein
MSDEEAKARAKEIHKKEVFLRKHPYIDTIGQRMVGYAHKIKLSDDVKIWEESRCFK